MRKANDNSRPRGVLTFKETKDFARAPLPLRGGVRGWGINLTRKAQNWGRRPEGESQSTERFFPHLKPRKTKIIMNSTFACFTSHKQSCFLTCEKSICHQWEINLSPVRNQFITCEKKGGNSVYAQGELQRLYPKSATNLPHFPQSATNLPHIYPPVYHNDNAFLWQIGRFYRGKTYIYACAKHLCETWIMNCFTTTDWTDWTDQCNLQFDNLQFTIYLWFSHLFNFRK